MLLDKRKGTQIKAGTYFAGGVGGVLGGVNGQPCALAGSKKKKKTGGKGGKTQKGKKERRQ